MKVSYRYKLHRIRVLSLAVLLAFLGQILAGEASFALASDLVPGGSSNQAPQGTAKTPDAILGQTGEWDEVEVQQATESDITRYPSGRLLRSRDAKTGTVTEYADDALNRISRVLYADGSEEKILSYEGNTDQPKKVERYNSDKVLTHIFTYTYTKTAGVDYVAVGVRGLASGTSYKFTYRIDGGLRKLSRFEISNGERGLNDYKYNVGSGEALSGGLSLLSDLGPINDQQLVGDWSIDILPDGTARCANALCSGATWDAVTGALTITLPDTRYSNGTIRMRLAEDLNGRGPSGVSEFYFKGNTKSYTTSTTYTTHPWEMGVYLDRNGLVVRTEMTYKKDGLVTRRDFKHQTYDLNGVRVVRLTGMDAKVTNAAGAVTQVRRSAREFKVFGNDLLLSSRTDYNPNMLFSYSGQIVDERYTFDYTRIDGKAYLASVYGELYYSTGRKRFYTTVYGMKKIGTEVVTATVDTRGEEWMGNMYFRSQQTQGSEYEVFGGKTLRTNTVYSYSVDEFRSGVLSTTTSQNQLTQERTTDGGYIRLIDTTNRVLSHMDLSVSESSSSSVYINMGSQANGSESTTVTNGIRTVTRTAGYEKALALHQAANPDVWKSFTNLSDNLRPKDKSEYDASGRLIQTTFVNGDVKKFGADGRVTEFYDAAAKTTTAYHPGTDRIKSVTDLRGVTKTYGMDGVLVRQDEPNGDYAVFSNTGVKVYAFESATGNRTEYDPADGAVQKILFGDGRILIHSGGKPAREEFANGDYRLFDSAGKTSVFYSAGNGTVRRYLDGILVREEYADGGWKEMDAQGKVVRSMDKDGYDQDGFGRDGFHKTSGLDREGYGRDGYHGTSGFNRQGYGRDGFDRDGYDRALFGRDGFHKTTGLDREGYGRDGFNPSGIDREGYAADGFHSVTGLDRKGFAKDGFDPSTGLDPEGYGRDGYHAATGFNRQGYGRDGFHRTTGLDASGYARDGFNAAGMNRAGDVRALDADGKLRSFFDNAAGILTEYAPSGTALRVAYPDGRVLLNDAQGRPVMEKLADGTNRLYNSEGWVYREERSDKSFRLLDRAGNVTLEQNDHAILAYDTADVQNRVGRLVRRTQIADGQTQDYGYDGLTRILKQVETRTASGKLLSKTVYDAAGAHEYTYHADGTTLKSVRHPDGSYQLFSDSKQLIGERFSKADAEGAVAYEYDSKSRRIKTVFSDESYIVATYKDDPALAASALNTETFFDKNGKHLRTLIYNSKGEQVRRMVTENARTLDCFLDECWKEDMGFGSDWSAAGTGGARVAVIETGSADSDHAMAVAGILRRITGQNSQVSVFTAPDHIRVIDAIKMAATSGFRVINLSLEFMRDGIIGWGAALGYDADRAVREFKSLLQSAVDFARGLGATIIASAGNQGKDFSVLAELDGVISVGATDYMGRRIAGSGYGSALDFMASGYKVFSEGKLWTGTSFAAPMLTGMFAGLSMMGGSYNENQILGAMRASSTDLGDSGWDAYFGWGKANAGRAVSSLASGLYQMFVD